MSDSVTRARGAGGAPPSVDGARRPLLAATALASLSSLLALPAWAATDGPARRFAQLEQSLEGRLGVFAIDTGDGTQLGYRARERFPVCSTFKFLLAGAVLQRAARNPALLQRRIHYRQAALVTHAPVAEKHLADGMTVAELIDATLRCSDNAASNLLMKLLGGPAAVTNYARALGNRSFRLDHWEPDLTVAPGDRRDTATPEHMARSLQRLVLGDALPPRQRELLRQGLVGGVTGGALLRAGVPKDWTVGDKSGGHPLYGTRNDVAVLWPASGAPLVLAVYTTRRARDAAAREDVLAAAGAIVADWAKARR